MALALRSNVYSDVYITGNCVIGGTVTSLANPVNSLVTILQDQKTSGSNGGSATGAAWNTRTLNTSVIDQIGVSLGSNQFTLPAGTYHVQISTPACQVNNHRCRLYNVTTSSTVLLGTSECAQNTNPSNMSNRSFIDAYFTSAASGTYRVDHWCNTSFATQGLGMNATSGDVEIFTNVKIIKINSGAALNQWTTGGTAVYYNSGNVGVGTTNPLNPLTVFNTGVSVSNVSSSAASTAAYSSFVNTADNRRAFVGMDGTGLFALSTGALALGTDNTPVIIAPNYATGEKMRVTPGGNVGIGTTSPVSLLTVQGEARITGNLISAGFTSNATNTVFNFDTLTVPFVVASSSVGVGTTSPVTALDVYGVISTNGLPLPYCIASGTGTFGSNYATTPAHGGSYFWYDRTSPIVIPQGANITIEIWGQSGYNQQGIAIDPYNSSTSQFNIQNTSQSGINEINATYYGTSITAVAVDNTTQNPPWTMFSMLQSTTVAYYNWQQTIKFFNPATPSGNSKVVCGTVNGSGLHSAGNCAQFQGSIGFYSSTIAYTVTGFRILLVTTSTTTFSSTYSYRVYVS